MRRVVITGASVHTIIGSEKNIFWNNLIQGKSGLSDIDVIDTSDYQNKKGGQIRDQSMLEIIPPKEREDLGKCAQYALAVSIMALKDSGLELSAIARERMGVAFGTTEGEASCLQLIDDALYGNKDEDKELISKMASLYPTHRIASSISKYLKIDGDTIINSNACAAANYSIGYMYDLIKLGKLDYAVVGGADVFSRIAFTGFNRLLAVSPLKVSPFDQNRQGMMVSEGAGALIIETLESAKQRNADIYGEIIGYGISNDAYHMTTPQPEAEGVASAMNKALASANLSSVDVDYVSLHGTGTKANDNAEMLAMNKVFGKRVNKVYASSIKGALGHAMGAASAIEMVVCSMILSTGIIPPTINVQNVDDKCDFNLVCNNAISRKVNVIMNNAYAFGGSNSCIIIKGLEE